MEDAARSPAEPEALPAWPKLRAWLLAHPSHLLEDHELLAILGLKAPATNVIAFGPRALSRLQTVARHEADRRRAVEAAARANLAAQGQTHVAALDLMEARNLSDLAARLDASCQSRFGLLKAVVALERPGAVAPGWCGLEPGWVDQVLGPDGLSHLGPALPAVTQTLFPDAEVESLALVRMAPWAGARTGLVAFGSADAAGFGPDMGCELVAFLTRVVERMAERWPLLDPGP